MQNVNDRSRQTALMYRRRVLMESFTEKYGSLEAYSIGDCDGWVWNDPPMPWENNEGGRCYVGI